MLAISIGDASKMCGVPNVDGVIYQATETSKGELNSDGDLVTDGTLSGIIKFSQQMGLVFKGDYTSLGGSKSEWVCVFEPVNQKDIFKGLPLVAECSSANSVNRFVFMRPTSKADCVPDSAINTWSRLTPLLAGASKWERVESR